jgi:hypothetical protein
MTAEIKTSVTFLTEMTEMTAESKTSVTFLTEMTAESKTSPTFLTEMTAKNKTTKRQELLVLLHLAAAVAVVGAEVFIVR